jgi:SAM-dependent methyltransferase
MKRLLIHLFIICFSLTGFVLGGCSTASFPAALSPSPDASWSAASPYVQRAIHHPDGIGKFYLGREIAQVMGHQAAAWLERPSREVEEQPDAVVQALQLQPTDRVADMGAGTGYFSFRISPLVPEGKVFAVDVQPEMIDILSFLKQEYQADNVEPILGSETDPHLAATSIDLALMVDAYHEFAYPQEMMQGIVKALKPGGRVVLLEYRGENPLIPIKGLHKMTQRQVRKEMQAVGLVWQETQRFLPQQHLMIFQKPAHPKSASAELNCCMA